MEIAPDCTAECHIVEAGWNARRELGCKLDIHTDGRYMQSAVSTALWSTGVSRIAAANKAARDLIRAYEESSSVWACYVPGHGRAQLGVYFRRFLLNGHRVSVRVTE
jgi:hypothetical protein